MSVRVVEPGLFTTVQDLGRPGYQAYGVPPGGAMDRWSLRVANLLIGNQESDATLEITFAGPTLHFGEGRLIAVGGAALSVRAESVELPLWHAVWVPAGTEVALGEARAGFRAYLAIAGGIDVPEVLASRSTYTRARIGGVDGRRLRPGDLLPLGVPGPLSKRIARAIQHDGAGVRIGRVAPAGAEHPGGPKPALVRLIAGTHQAELTADSRAALHGETFRVSAQSDRMGYRLQGVPLELARPLELLSEGVVFGTVQLPPDGNPVVLMADRQTTGGYPRIGEIASVDLPVLAQLRPGDRLRFRECSVGESQALLSAREREIGRIAAALQALFP